jgi:hypothetical protein
MSNARASVWSNKFKHVIEAAYVSGTTLMQLALREIYVVLLQQVLQRPTALCYRLLRSKRRIVTELECS